jgi:hypothetical protein
MNKISEKIKLIDNVDARSSRCGLDINEMKRKHGVVLQTVEGMKAKMESEVTDLRLVINQALEEVMQNSLNKASKNTFSNRWRYTCIYY